MGERGGGRGNELLPEVDTSSPSLGNLGGMVGSESKIKEYLSCYSIPSFTYGFRNNDIIMVENIGHRWSF